MRYKYALTQIVHAKYSKINAPLNITTLIATWFCVGKSPLMPGTLASLAVYPLYYFALLYSSTYAEVASMLYIMMGVSFFLGIWAIGKYQSQTNSFDHQSVVIDEITGQLLTLAISCNMLYSIHNIASIFQMSHRNFIFFISFILFRFYDIKKPFFIKAVDRNFKSPFGVILDDILAAIMASGTIYIIYTICKYSYIVSGYF